LALGALVGEIAVAEAEKEHTHFFKNSDVAEILPLPPKDYPESLQGLHWMDQSGFYAHSDVPLGAPDLALSFGGDTAFHKLDRKTRTLKIDVVGPGWQWMNRWDGYMFAWAIGLVGFHYVMEFNEDYSFAQIYPTITLPFGMGVVSLPKVVMSFTMVLQKPPEGSCPPTAAATKKDITSCATWDRVSTNFMSHVLGSWAEFHYYVFRIVDADGKPVQPYFEQFESFARQSTKPSPSAAKIFGIDLGKTGAEDDTSFVLGKPAPKVSNAKESAEL
jgi:hypothetical protein